jgi:hypothetical protein
VAEILVIYRTSSTTPVRQAGSFFLLAFARTLCCTEDAIKHPSAGQAVFT